MLKNLILSIVLGLILSPIKAQIDDSFGTNGKLQFSISAYNAVSAIKLLQNDTLLVLTYGGEYDSSFYDMSASLIKITPDGKYDSTFGNNGITSFDFDSFNYSTATNLVIIENDIYVIGNGYHSNNSDYLPMCIVKLKRNGSKDSSFATNSTLKIGFLKKHEVGLAIAKYPNNKLVVTGGSHDTIENYTVPVVARIDASQNLDTNFANTGKVAIDLVNGLQSLKKGTPPKNNPQHLAGGTINDLVVLNDGHIIIAGIYEEECFIGKLTPSGQFDYSFNGIGYVTFKAKEGYPNQITKLLELPDGTILFNVFVPELTNKNIHLGRVNSNSGSYLLEEIDLNGNIDDFTDMALTPSNELVISARSKLPQNTSNSHKSDFFSLTYFPDFEQLENYHTTQIPFNQAYQNGADAIVVQNNGRIICAGYTHTANTSKVDIALMAFKKGLINNNTDIYNDNNFHLYPNPTKNVLNIKVHQLKEKLTYQLLSYNGKLLNEQSINNSVTSINTAHLANGIYFLKVNEQVMKFVKQ